MSVPDVGTYFFFQDVVYRLKESLKTTNFRYFGF